MDNEKRKIEKLNRIFESDGKEIRDQLIFAGLLLTIFERFKSFVVENVDFFFSEEVSIKNGRLNCKRGVGFKNLIKEKSKGGLGQHNNKEFRASMHFFQDLGAIDEFELGEIERIYTLRNEIGHEMLRIIADDEINKITLYDVVFAFCLYIKISQWWFKEVEEGADPDMTQEKYDSISWDEVQTVDTLIIREILQKALSDNEEWKIISDMAEVMRKNAD